MIVAPAFTSVGVTAVIKGFDGVGEVLDGVGPVEPEERLQPDATIVVNSASANDVQLGGLRVMTAPPNRA